MSDIRNDSEVKAGAGRRPEGRNPEAAMRKSPEGRNPETAMRRSPEGRNPEAAMRRRPEGAAPRQAGERLSREERLRRKKIKKIKKIAKFVGAWLALLAVVAVIIVVIVSCSKGCAASAASKNDGKGQGAGGQKTEQAADANTSATDKDGNVIAATDANGNVIEATDANGNPVTSEETTEPAKVVTGQTDWDGVTAEELIESGQAEKVVFLTFDDGPGPQTPRLLDILAKYDVKATFFVVGWEEEFYPEIAREYREGHTVAVHSMTHSYKYIYTGADVFWDDNAQMASIIKEQTGYTPNLMRFPGGASNAVSAEYCEGIMTRLTAEAEAYGYDYVDWNVSSGDGGRTEETSEVYQNVIDGIETFDISVVLMHDSHDYTVNAVEDIIKYCLDRGYTILPLHKGIYTCHHGVFN